MEHCDFAFTLCYVAHRQICLPKETCTSPNDHWITAQETYTFNNSEKWNIHFVQIKV